MHGASLLSGGRAVPLSVALFALSLGLESPWIPSLLGSQVSVCLQDYLRDCDDLTDDCTAVDLVTSLAALLDQIPDTISGRAQGVK